MKIVLVGLLYNSNIGDRLLFECSEYLLAKLLREDSNLFVLIDFHARNAITNESAVASVDSSVKYKINKLFTRKVNSNVVNFAKYHIWTKSRGKSVIEYYKKQLQDCDLLFFIGGGTLSYHLDYDWSRYYYLLTQIAKEYRIPVIMNGLGVESAFNRRDYRARMYRTALNNSAVKAISTRNDTADLLEGYISSSYLKGRCIADSAVWSAETFGVKKQESDVIGIGIIAAKRFDECNRLISSEQYEEYLVNLIDILDRNNRKWEIFTNGATIDNDYVDHFCSKYNISKDKTRIPTDGKELVELIATYSVIATSRLHSCIVSCSLDVPFIAIIWNDKLKMFATALKCSERAIENDLSPEFVYDVIKDAEKKGYNEEVRNRFRMTTIEFLREALIEVGLIGGEI